MNDNRIHPLVNDNRIHPLVNGNRITLVNDTSTCE